MFRGRVRREIGDDLSPGFIAVTWFGAFLSLLLGIPLAAVAWLGPEPIPWGAHFVFDPLISFALLFGVMMLYKAARATLDYARFGRVLLRIVGEHAIVGGRLAAIVTLPPKAATASRIAAELVCWRSEPAANDGRLPKAKELGQQMLGGTGAPIVWTSGPLEFPVRRRLAMGTAAISIPIPSGLPETDLRAADYGHNSRVSSGWELRVHAEVPGVDLSRSFEVPVLAA